MFCSNLLSPNGGGGQHPPSPAARFDGQPLRFGDVWDIAQPRVPQALTQHPNSFAERFWFASHHQHEPAAWDHPGDARTTNRISPIPELAPVRNLRLAKFGNDRRSCSGASSSR